MQFLRSVKNYWELIKPKIVLLLVFTGVAGMLVAYKESGLPLSPLQLLVGTAAVFLGSAGAEVLTNYHDRDIDSVMKRTSNRPIPSGRISGRNALVFGFAASALSVVLAYWFNWLAALLMVIGLVDNVVVYSLWLKRRSWVNIILGGVSGGVPVLVGYAAIAGTLSPLAIFMCSLVVVWIPTHIWSLAIKTRADYKEAGVPMLPVIVSMKIATVCIAITSSLLAVFSLSILFVTAVSPIYTVSALTCGALLLGYSLKLAVDKTEKTAWTLFKITSPYLTVIFAVLILNFWV
ncbi:MAG: heme o synthase [Nitrososphaerota archaeon]|nr:heme o synthase [Nitrososphaerota archaeon]